MTGNEASLVRAFRFLGRVRFTTILLLGGAVVMTAGTVVESRAGRELAWSTVYGTLWFDVFLFLIAVNLIVAVVNRIPIRRQQWPFVVTHAAIVLLLAGAWISRTYGYEGRMMVFEGGQESRILLDASEVRVRWRPEVAAGHGGDAPLEAVFPVPAGGGRMGAVLQEEGQGRPGIRVAEYVPAGIVEVDLREGGRGGVPGVQIRLVSGDEEVRESLLAGDPRLGRKDLGFLEVAFAALPPGAAPDEVTAFARQEGAAVVVSARGGGAPIRLPVPASLGDDLPCGAGVVARVRRFLIRARVVDGALVEAATGPLNPAAVVEIRSEMRRELHTVFARMPEAQKVEGRDERRPLVASVGLDASALATRPRLSLLLAADERLYVVLASAAERSPAVPVRVGGSVALEVLGAELRVERLLRSARPEVRVRASAGGPGDGRAFVRLEVTRGGETASIWLARGGGWRGIALDGSGKVEASFGPRSRPLPFAVALHEFEVVHHPGSARPAEYRSVVEVKPAGTGLPPQEAVISMNRPLTVLGFRLFQSSYQLGRDGGPDATVLSVSRDPGVPIVYTSFALLIVGIAWGLRGVRQKSEAWVAWVSGEQDRPGPARAAGPGEAYAEGSRLHVGL